jgi:SulP family sulfate permease
VSDHSGIEAIERVIDKYIAVGKEVTLTHLSPECTAILEKANPNFAKYIQSSIEDPRYHVVTDLLDAEV